MLLGVCQSTCAERPGRIISRASTGEPGLERTIERPGQAQEGGTARADGVRLREQLIVAGGAWGTATSPAEHSSGWG